MKTYSKIAGQALCILLLPACAMTNQAYDGGSRPESEVATLLATGDTGFRIDRTVYNRGVAAQLSSVGGKRVGSMAWGFPAATMALPGATQLNVHCSLPTSPRDARPFTTTYTYAEIVVDVDLKAGRIYKLRCEPMLGGRVRGWVELQD